jgi:uncharacterized caspase-like protein
MTMAELLIGYAVAIAIVFFASRRISIRTRVFGVALLVLLSALTLVTSYADSKRSPSESRYALVIGNGVYQHAPALENVPKDAAAIADALSRLDFNVTQVNDVNFEGFRRALLQFGRTARNADIAIVYFAGHGLATGRENWLLPTDAELKSDLDVDGEAIDLQAALRTVSNAKKLGLVILDASRENPFLAKMQRSAPVRGIDRGLARLEPDDNVLVAFAAREGTTAVDGPGPLSPFTSAILNNIETPGLEIGFLFRNVHDDVLQLTHNEQEPAVYGSLSKDEIFLKPAPTTEVSLTDDSGPAADEIAWSFLHESLDVGTIRQFVTDYPSSKYAPEAKTRMASLDSAQVRLRAVSAGPSADEIGWSYLEDSNSSAALRRFLDRFPESPHASDARQRIDVLEQITAATVPESSDQSVLPPEHNSDQYASPPEHNNDQYTSPPEPEHKATSGPETAKDDIIRPVKRRTKAVEAAWQTIQKTKDPYLLRKFAEAYPTKRYQAVAQERLKVVATQMGAPALRTDGSKKELPSDDAAYYVLQCDRFAADPGDSSRPAGIQGVATNNLNAAQGAAACRRAIAYYPKEPRLQFQLCRCLVKQKPEEALDVCNSAVNAAKEQNSPSLGLYSATSSAAQAITAPSNALSGAGAGPSTGVTTSPDANFRDANVHVDASKTNVPKASLAKEPAFVPKASLAKEPAFVPKASLAKEPAFVPKASLAKEPALGSLKPVSGTTGGTGAGETGGNNATGSNQNLHHTTHQIHSSVDTKHALHLDTATRMEHATLKVPHERIVTSKTNVHIDAPKTNVHIDAPKTPTTKIPTPKISNVHITSPNVPTPHVPTPKINIRVPTPNIPIH